MVFFCKRRVCREKYLREKRKIKKSKLQHFYLNDDNNNNNNTFDFHFVCQIFVSHFFFFGSRLLGIRRRRKRRQKKKKKKKNDDDESMKNDVNDVNDDRIGVLLERMVTRRVTRRRGENPEEDHHHHHHHHHPSLLFLDATTTLRSSLFQPSSSSCTSRDFGGGVGEDGTTTKKNDFGGVLALWKRIDEEEERETRDVAVKHVKKIISGAAVDVHRLYYYVAWCGTPNEDEERTTTKQKSEAVDEGNQEKNRNERRRTNVEMVLAKLLRKNGDYYCALILLDLIVGEEDVETSSRVSVGVGDDDVREGMKTLQEMCMEEISRRRERKRAFANDSNREATQNNTNYDDIPAVLLRNGAYETSRAIGLARLSSTSASIHNTDEKISAADAYNVALACLGANNDLESALELLSRSDVLRTFRFDQKYWLRVSSCVLQWIEKRNKEMKMKDEDAHAWKKLLSSLLLSATMLRELRERGESIFLKRSCRWRKSGDDSLSMDEEEVEEKFLEELRVDENTSDSSAILDELCNKFKVVMLERASSL